MVHDGHKVWCGLHEQPAENKQVRGDETAATTLFCVYSVDMHVAALLERPQPASVAEVSVLNHRPCIHTGGGSDVSASEAHR